tara:strand:- start:1505 stop:2230 length:726 start_codon:yes stop_codon:yes gene_type:complete
MLSVVAEMMRRLLVFIWNKIPAIRSLKKYLSNMRLKKRLSQEGQVLLNFGTGPYPKAGWINSDISIRAEFYLDATLPLPIPDGCLDAIFSEHLVEHLSFVEAQNWISECYRCLKPGGTFRCATPGLHQLIAFYEGEGGATESELIDRHYTRFSREISREYGGLAPRSLCIMLNDKLRLWGDHRFIYDEQLFAEILTAKGFEDLRFENYGQSTIPYLRGLESHADDTDWMRNECFIIEGRKP